MYLQKLKSAYPTLILVIALTGLSILTTWLIVTHGYIVAPIVLVVLVCLLALIWMARDYSMGIYFIFILAVFMSFINRMLASSIPFGIPLDILAGLTFFFMLFVNKEKVQWHRLKNPIIYIYVVIVIYLFLQGFNPNAVSPIGWLVALRGNTSFLLLFAFFVLFHSLEEIKKFMILWIALAVIVGLYGIWQQVVGLNTKELQWIYSNPGRTGLLVIWGQIRKFSFLSDPSIFGLFMAFSALACFIISLGPYSTKLRWAAFFAGVMMLVSMSFSGTRTATAMFVAGVAFYIVVTLKSRKTIIVMLVAGAVGGAILFGPFHNATIKRVRSTLSFSEDASMGVRDKKRVRLQEYVRSHPFGGGPNTTGTSGVRYSEGHPLAEGWDADSGYLMTALELGWIGLIIGMSFFFFTIVQGIHNYFALRDPLLKNINLVFIVPYFALSVAHFTQDAMFQKPVYLVIIATYAVMLTLPAIAPSLRKKSKTI